MSVNKKIFINTLSKNINNAKINGFINNKKAFILNMLDYYKVFTYNNLNYLDHFNKIDNLLNHIKSDISICKARVKLPSYINNDNPIIETLVANVKNIITNTTKEKIFIESNVLYDSYKFDLNDIIYSDNKNKTYLQLSIHLLDLQDGFLKVFFGPDEEDYIIYGEDNAWLTIAKEDIKNITYFTSSTTDFSHILNIKTYTEFNGIMVSSNTATLTINRTNLGINNQPPTIGDAAYKSNNRTTTTFTLAMFTTNLTPPYNDPEGDLIDAIRIDEISTANLGKFYLNDEEIVVGQIITREDLNNGLFTHVGPDVNTIETDALNFSARDEGSQIWVQ